MEESLGANPLRLITNPYDGSIGRSPEHLLALCRKSLYDTRRIRGFRCSGLTKSG
jgi:hypothetical protein